MSFRFTSKFDEDPIKTEDSMPYTAFRHDKYMGTFGCHSNRAFKPNLSFVLSSP